MGLPQESEGTQVISGISSPRRPDSALSSSASNSGGRVGDDGSSSPGSSSGSEDDESFEEEQYGYPYADVGEIGSRARQQADNLNALFRELVTETKIKDGAENMLQVLHRDSDSSELTELMIEVDSELQAARDKIYEIERQIQDLGDAPDTVKSVKRRAWEFLSSTEGAVFGERLTQSPSSSESSDGDDDFRFLVKAAVGLLLALSSGTKEEEKRLQDAMRLSELLRRNMRIRYELNIQDIIKVAISLLSESSPSRDLKRMGYMILRHSLIDTLTWRTISAAGVDFFIMRALTRDTRNSQEKEECIKLIRAVIDLAADPSRASSSSGEAGKRIPLADSVVRGLVCIAETADDPLRAVCLETLAEIAVLDISLLSSSNAIRVLLQVFTDGPMELTTAIAATFIYIADTPDSRSALTPGVDFEIALSGFTDIYGSGDSHLNRLQSCSKTVSAMLRSWSGALYLCLNGLQSISSLVEALRIPTVEMREVLLDMFFEVFRIKTPSWYHAFLDGKHLTMNGKVGTASAVLDANNDSHKTDEKVTVVDHYISFLLSIFLEVGLLEALISVIEESNSILSRKAVLLLGEVLVLSNRLLPAQFSARVQSLPSLFAQAVNVTSELSRNNASMALSSIESVDRNHKHLVKRVVPLQNEGTESLDYGPKGMGQMDQVKARMGLMVDDKHFQAQLIETNVMATRDHTKWNFNVLAEIVEGSLHNPRRLEEALKSTKFVKRLSSFFHPLSERFSHLKRSPSNQKFVNLGISFVTALLENPEGVQFLSTDPLLLQLCDCFCQLDPYNANATADPFFSRKRLEDTLSIGYFQIVGLLTGHNEGIALLEKLKMFTILYHIGEVRSRDDVLRALLENMDYSREGHPRVILSKALTSSYKHVRMYATERTGRLALRKTPAESWTLQLLSTQLYDASMEVCEMAVHILEEACKSMEALQTVIQLRPSLEHLGPIGNPLLLRFLSTPIGFSYLRQVDYIEQQMESWLHEHNLIYTIRIETHLLKSLFPRPEFRAEPLIFGNTAPPHFYGELTRTEEGCTILREKGDFEDFALFIRQYGMESKDKEILMQLKSVLWAVGNIGSTEGGLAFLEEEEIIRSIVEIAEESQVLSLKGTCFFVLGLIASTPAGADYLSEFGWESTLLPSGAATGLCLPVDIRNFVAIPPQHNFFKEMSPPASTLIKPPTSTLEINILTHITNLSNHVQANVSFRALAKLKRTHKALFQSPQLFYRVLCLIGSSHYRLPVLRFIYDIFDVQFTSETIEALLATAQSLSIVPEEPKKDSSSSLAAGIQKQLSQHGSTRSLSVNGNNSIGNKGNNGKRPRGATFSTIGWTSTTGTGADGEEEVERKGPGTVEVKKAAIRIVGFSTVAPSPVIA